MANSFILSPSSKFGQVDSLIFGDWDDEMDDLYSDDSEESELIPDLYLGGYFPISVNNKIVVYEVAYTKQQQLVWSFVCEKSDVTDAQAEVLSRAEQTPEAMELKRKWGQVWEGISTKKYKELKREFFKARDAENVSEGEFDLWSQPVTKLTNGAVMTVMHITLD